MPVWLSHLREKMVLPTFFQKRFRVNVTFFTTGGVNVSDFSSSRCKFSLAPLDTSYCLQMRVLVSYECVYCPSIVRLGRKGD